jgi:urease accessory protein UreF
MSWDTTLQIDKLKRRSRHDQIRHGTHFSEIAMQLMENTVALMKISQQCRLSPVTPPITTNANTAAQTPAFLAMNCPDKL